MKIVFLVISAITLILTGCVNKKVEYKNNTHYKLKLGDTITLYATWSSAYINCFPFEELKHLKFVDRMTVERAILEDGSSCIGCEETRAILYRAESVGVEKFKLWKTLGGMKCDSSLNIPRAMSNIEEIIVEISAN
ncbi:MAG: hypothetical protein ACKVOK_07235 [Flavobacteriales bacterium]